jgi:unconventional prefoldin RPB5 interactor 1
MIDYNLNEVGHIVAQLDLEDDDDDGDVDDSASASDFTSSEHPDEDTPYTSGHSDVDSDEEEDEFGRSRIAISEEYHSKMQELSARLIGNLGPAPALIEESADIDPADARRLVIRDTKSSNDSQEPKTGRRESTSKHVKFAEALDVAPSDKSLARSTLQNEDSDSKIVSEPVERKTALSHSMSRETPRPSIGVKFTRQPYDSETSQDEEEAPSGPPGQTIAEKLTERPATKKKIAAPSADGHDPVMQRRELAEAYYSRRNNIIRQQGGFKANPDEDDELGELMEERDGKVVKVSRFKAARIRS